MNTGPQSISRRETRQIVANLAQSGIAVRAVRCGQTIHVRPVTPLATTDEVRALAAFLGRTGRVAWHGVVTHA